MNLTRSSLRAGSIPTNGPGEVWRSTPQLVARSEAERARKLVNRLMQTLGTSAAPGGVAVLGLVVVSVAISAARALSWDFFTKPPTSSVGPGGGVSSALMGSLLIVGLATAMALPVGILIAIFLTEFAPPRVAAPIQLVLDVLNGLPTIVTGIFVYGVLVVGHLQVRMPGRSRWRS